MTTTVDAFRTAYRAHLRECPLPDGSPDRARHLDGRHWARYAPHGWVEALGPDPCDSWRLTPEGDALAQSVQLHAGRPAHPSAVERARTLQELRAVQAHERKRLQAVQAARLLVARYGAQLALEALTEAIGVASRPPLVDASRGPLGSGFQRGPTTQEGGM